MQEIFNEGRVVGLSAYETYVRHHMEEYGDDPDNPPASEQEWLASSISLGTSVLIQMSKNGAAYTSTKTFQGGDGSEGKYWGVEIKMPKKSRLCAANSIIASIFLGEGVLDTTNPPFCKSVQDYGFLSSKIGSINWNNPDGNPYMDPSNAKQYDAQIKEYMKLIDGVVVQPCKDYNRFIPDMQDSPKIRLLFRSKIETTFYLLLSGFTNCSVISGISNVHSGTIADTECPEAGDFLGPAVFPWSSKILITTPTSAVARLYADKFARSLQSHRSNAEWSAVLGGDTPCKVKEDAVIDYNHAYFSEFYSGASSLANKRARCLQTVSQYAPIGDGINQLAVISRDEGEYDPPALYGTNVTGAGEGYLYPIDCAAPGTVKIFPSDVSDEEIKAFLTRRPGCHALIRDNAGSFSYVIIKNSTIIKSPMCEVTKNTFKVSTDANAANIPNSGYYITIKSGSDVEVSAISISNVPNIYYQDTGEPHVRDFVENIPPGQPYASFFRDSMELGENDEGINFISARTLSYALQNNKRLDVLGKPMRLFRQMLDLGEKDIDTGNNRLLIGNPKASGFRRNIIDINPTEFRHIVLPYYDSIEYVYERNPGMEWGAWRTSEEDINVPYNNYTVSERKGIEAHIRLRFQRGSEFIYDAFSIGLGTTAATNHRDAGYIRMANGKRLYISNYEPTDTDIPDGSIGIGW